ncbi:hypothetical protein BDD12DRAFT_895551 [Trichophaea hybrida]|nr:hypothetical protein BDD12DRAFT_895551 [Trichophaea hybrida]
MFGSKFPIFDLTKRLALYCLLMYNFRGIDGLILSLDAVRKIAVLYRLQTILVAKHSDSESVFFREWDYWMNTLAGYEVTATFVWTTTSQAQPSPKSPKDLKERNLPGGGKQANPSYTVQVRSINIQLAEHLEHVLTEVRPKEFL